MAIHMRPKSKYGSVKTVVDGIRFDSKKEAARFCELKLLEKAGAIRRLEPHPRFKLFVAGPDGEMPYVGDYVADFRYQERTCPNCISWRTVVEDVKGVRTPVYKLKKRMVEAQYGIRVVEL